VEPGDSITVTIAKVSSTQWSITLTDNGQSGHATQAFTTTQSYSGPGTSAEWILEAPSLCNIFGCTTSTLADYGLVTFDPDTANGTNPGLTLADFLVMVNSSDTAYISTPSVPDSDTDGFAVAYGSTSPNPPSS